MGERKQYLLMLTKKNLDETPDSNFTWSSKPRLVYLRRRDEMFFRIWVIGDMIHWWSWWCIVCDVCVCVRLYPGKLTYHLPTWRWWFSGTRLLVGDVVLLLLGIFNRRLKVLKSVGFQKRSNDHWGLGGNPGIWPSRLIRNGSWT